MNILILGCGHIAGFGKGRLRSNHAMAIKRRFEDAQVSCYDISPARTAAFAKSYGFHPINDFMNLAVSDFDLIICATPAASRYNIIQRLAREISETALVVVEKPIADRIVETDKLACGVERFFVNFPRSFQTGIERLKQEKWPAPRKIIVHYYKDVVSIGIHAFQLLSDFYTGVSIQDVTAFGDDYRVMMQWGEHSFPAYFLNSGTEATEIFEIDIFSDQNRVRLSAFAENVEFFDAVENDAGETELLLASSRTIENDGFSILYDDLYQALNGKGVSDRLVSVRFNRAVEIHNAVIRHFGAKGQ